MISRSRIPLAAALMLLALLAPLWGAYTTSATRGVDYCRGDPTWEYFKTDLQLTSTFTLWADNSSGSAPVILTPGVNYSDLPDNLMICSGNLSMSVTPSAQWLVTSGQTVVHSAYSPSPNAPDPSETWSTSSSVMPVTWNPTSTISCAMDSSTNEPIACPSVYASPDSYGTEEWNANPASAQYNVDYRRYVGGDVYDGKKAMIGLMCNGTLSIGSNSVRVSNQPITLNQSLSATSTLTPTFLVNLCRPNVEEIPSFADPTWHMKYFFYNNRSGNQLPANLTHSFNVRVANPTSCYAELVSAVPERLEDLGPLPLPNNASYEVNVTIRNPQSDIYIQANNITLNGASGWTVAPSNVQPNGFGTPIAPLATQLLRLNLTTPLSGPVNGPVRVAIGFNSSTPLCNDTVCNSTLNLTLLTSTSLDLVSVAVAPASAALGETVTLEAITYNGGASGIPIGTNTSYSVDGGAPVYFSVPANLAPTTFPSATDPQRPDPPYVSRTVSYICEFPHYASIVVRSDYNNQLDESNEINNYAAAVVNCGGQLGCYDYM